MQVKVAALAIVLLGGTPRARAAEMTGALEFNDGAFVRIKGNAVYKAGVAGSLTIEAWFKLRAQVGSITIVSGDDGRGPWFKLTMIAEPGNEGYLLWMFATQGGNRGAEGTRSREQMRNDQWYHAVGVLDRTGQKHIARLYLNGVLASGVDVTGLVQDPTGGDNPWFIGADPAWGGYEKLGPIIDEVRVYDRPLGAGEIAAHYNGGQGAPGQPEAGLVAGWRFDELEGSTVHDYSGSGHDGIFSSKQLINRVQGILPVAGPDGGAGDAPSTQEGISEAGVAEPLAGSSGCAMGAGRGRSRAAGWPCLFLLGGIVACGRRASRRGVERARQRQAPTAP